MNTNDASVEGRTIGSVHGGGGGGGDHCRVRRWCCSPEKTIIIQTYNWSSHRTFISQLMSQLLMFWS